MRKSLKLTPLTTIRKKIIDELVDYDVESYALTADTTTVSGLSGYGTITEILQNTSYTTQFIQNSQLFLFDNFNVVDTYVLASFARYLLEILAREYGSIVLDVEEFFSMFTSQFAKFAKMTGFNSILSPEIIANNRTDMLFDSSTSNIDMSNAVSTEALNTQVAQLTKEKELLSALESDKQGHEHVSTASDITSDIIQNVVANFNEIVNTGNTAGVAGGGATTQVGNAITGSQNFGLQIPLPEISATSGGSGQNTGPFANNVVGNPQLLNANINSFATTGEVTGTTQQPTYAITGNVDGSTNIGTNTGHSQDASNNASEQASSGKNDNTTDNVSINVNTAVGSNFLQTNNNTTTSNTGTNTLSQNYQNKTANLGTTREHGYRQSPMWAQNLIALMRTYNDFNINWLVIESFAYLRPFMFWRAWGDEIIHEVI